MKKIFQEAADLFRHCESKFPETATAGDMSEFYRGLTLLAEGLNQLEKRFEQIESATEGSQAGISNGVRRRPVRRIFLMKSAPHTP